MNSLYLITGGAGHLGSAVVRKLVDLKKNVRILVLPGEKNIPNGDIEVFYGDVCDKDSLHEFFLNPENKKIIVVHCAGIVSIASKYVQKVHDVNVTGTKNVVNLCKEQGVEKLIYVSSVHAIPEKPKGEIITEVNEFNPKDVVGVYAKTKSEATAYVLDAFKGGLNAIVVHPSGIFGPYDFGRGHSTQLIIDYYNGSLTAGTAGGYDFVDVRDVANGIWLCIEKGRYGQCYILSNRYLQVKELLDGMHELTGKKKIKTYLPLWFVKLTAYLAEAYYKIKKQTPLYTAYSIYTLNTYSIFSHKKADDELGYTTRGYKETLKDTIKWLEKEGRI